MKKRGYNINEDVITIEEAKDELLRILRGDKR
jgi:DNA-binding winged helix-turn-helix (wHTH) protein